MNSKAAITINKPLQEVASLWRSPEYRLTWIDEADAEVNFTDAPGDRGTEIHVELKKTAPGGKLGEAALTLLGNEPLAKVKDDLRHFKQLVETGEIARSEASPEGEQLERKLKQRPAQPLDQSELEKAGV
jgi:uncharacterized membrane protein